jgi:hypothetical protein
MHLLYWVSETYFRQTDVLFNVMFEDSSHAFMLLKYNQVNR